MKPGYSCGSMESRIRKINTGGRTSIGLESILGVDFLRKPKIRIRVVRQAVTNANAVDLR